MNNRELFFRHVAQTSPAPLAIEIVQAEDVYLHAADGRKYIDLIGGISVANTGHRHPAVTAAISRQLENYLHVLVYGELIQSPQAQYAGYLAAHLPPSLDSVYFTNSGAEAVEGALKLAKRVTNRREIIAFHHAYHGSTQGALSVIGDEEYRNAFRPLLPGISHYQYNAFDALENISSHTACVIAETVQGEAGVIRPRSGWLQALRKKCDEHGVLLILDEIQAGFGRTGTLWAFSQYEVVPDILLLGKALGGGMPLGAFIANRELMRCITSGPALGHITTFGGHPVCCAAGLAAMQVLTGERLYESVKKKENLFHSLLVHDRIKEVRSAGLLMAIVFESFEFNKKVIDRCIEKGLLTDWFLFAPDCMRIAPPLTISEEVIQASCHVIMEAVGEVV